MRKSLNFGQKAYTNFVGKKSTFWCSLQRYLSGLKIVLFYLKYQKTIFADLNIPKKPNEKILNVSTKAIDYPLRKMSIFWRFSKH